MSQQNPSPTPALTLDIEERVPIGGTEQWIRLRTRGTGHPVLLVIQQGPGFPMLNEAAEASRRWRLEEEFVVVYWDQRGCGKSYGPVPPESLTLSRLVEDTGELLTFLGRRFEGRSIFVAGLSQGGTIAAMTAARFPERVSAVICADLDIDFAEAERVAYDFAMSQAAERGNRRALRELRRIGAPPHLDARTFGTRVKWLANFGGVHRKKTYGGLFLAAVSQMLTAYSLSDIVKTLLGIGFVQNRLLPDLAGLNLFQTVPRLDVPVYLLQGRHDYAAPPAIAEKYYHALKAPQGKQLIWFEESAHNPWYEEPEKFREVLLAVKRDSGGLG